MPTLDEHEAISIVRLLNVGESKTGKTGATASLAQAGYRLWFLDYDDGLDILVNVLKPTPAALKRVTFETCQDKVEFRNGVARFAANPRAFKMAGEALTKWGAENFTPRDVLVLDTLTSFSEAGFRYVLSLAGRLNQRPQQADYGAMANSVTVFLEMLKTIPCHLIVNTHIRFFGADDETQMSARGLPNAVGQQIPRTVSRMFNTVVLTRSSGSGPATRRLITTRPQGVVEVATSNPAGVKAEYPVDKGMASLFYDILGHGPQGSTLSPTSVEAPQEPATHSPEPSPVE